MKLKMETRLEVLYFAGHVGIFLLHSPTSEPSEGSQEQVLIISLTIINKEC